jgi:hypothetical protein
MSLTDMLRLPQRQTVPREALEARRERLAKDREDAKAIAELRASPAWLRVERLMREQIEVFRSELESPALPTEEIRSRQWQIHSLRWLLELPDTIRRKLEDEDALDEKTVPTSTLRQETRG